MATISNSLSCFLGLDIRKPTSTVFRALMFDQYQWIVGLCARITFSSASVVFFVLFFVIVIVHSPLNFAKKFRIHKNQLS